MGQVMLYQDKRVDFIKNLSSSRLKKSLEIDLNKNSIKIDKSIKIEKLYSSLTQKYRVEQKKDIEYLKFELKKQYF